MDKLPKYFTSTKDTYYAALKEENKRTEWPNDVHMKTESHIDRTDGPENLKLYTGHLVLASCHVENRQIRFCSCRGEVKKCLNKSGSMMKIFSVRLALKTQIW